MKKEEKNRQIRKCMNGNLAAYLAPLANSLGGPISNGVANCPQQNQLLNPHCLNVIIGGVQDDQLDLNAIKQKILTKGTD